MFQPGRQLSPVSASSTVMALTGQFSTASRISPERAAECGATLVDKDTLFKDSDLVSVHVQLSDRTRGLVGARELSLMKPSAYLINISRGPIVD